MPRLNVEIKAKCHNPEGIRKYLLASGAKFIGTDKQTDTYFNPRHGRLKLREGNIEKNLIFYKRSNKAGPKSSHFYLIKVNDPGGLKELLEKSLGIKTVVRKRREIYYIGNVKFHIDEVPELGSFVEIEAGNILADKPEAELRQQCEFYMKEFGIRQEDLIDASYSDMLMQLKKATG